MQEHILSFYLYHLLAHAVVGFGAYLLFGGWRLFGSGAAAAAESPEDATFASGHKITLGVIGALCPAVVLFELDAGMAAFAGAGLLAVAGVASESDAIADALGRGADGLRREHAGGIAERTGGLDIITGMLACFSTPATVPTVGAFVTGLLSAFSSTSGVVLPAFLPTVSGLIAKLGGGVPWPSALR
ncbi:MAG: hypothetical protein L0099_06560 [Acidobacteria bacterium]|nr:hypothetical protein [Acidobacteriota bacterium]